MSRTFLTLFFFVIVIGMAVTNLVGMHAVLGATGNLATVPVFNFAVRGAGGDPANLSSAYRLYPELLSSLIEGDDAPEKIKLLSANYRLLGYVDRLDFNSSGHLQMSGWAVPANIERTVSFVGVWHDGRMLALSKPNVERDDVDASLGREVGKSGFVFDFNFPQNDECSMGVFALDDLLKLSWLQLPNTACPNM